MSVNSINAITNTYQAQSTGKTSEKVTDKSVKDQSTASSNVSTDSGVVYEPSAEAATQTTTPKKTYTPNTELLAKLKADADARTAQLRSLVQQLMLKQGNAYGQANDMWKFLASGEYTVDPATKLQAQKDIAEDGYWGVEQTSDRIIDFATALTGGDPDKIEDMREAFKKGYKQAEETWGGKLPEISQRTYDAVMEKFDKLAEAAKQTESTEA